MAEGNGEKFISWRWIVGILIAIVFAASGIIVGDTRSGISEAKSRIDQLQKEKVDIDRYQVDMKEIKTDLKTLINMHMNGNGKK